MRPKVHLSSPRTMLDAAAASAGRRASATSRHTSSPAPAIPPLREHANLVTPWDLAAVVDASAAPLDVMLEAKAKDLALHLRRTVADVLPDLAALEQRRRA